MCGGTGRTVRRIFQLTVGNMGINFGRSQIGMAEDFFQDPHVNFTILIQQGGRRMTQLMRRIALAIESGRSQAFPNNLLNTPRT